MDIQLIYLIKALILPPANLLITGIVGLLILKKRVTLGKTLLSISLASLYLLSTPLFSSFIALTQEQYPALNDSLIKNSPAQAIVVLGGGTRSFAAEYENKFIIHNRVFDRLRYATRIAKKTGLPLLVSGGKVVDHGQPSEAELIQETLINDFDFKAKWLEKNSRNTAENALLSFALLSQKNIKRIFLVTHAVHMVRAVDQFRNAGFQVTPAPTAFIASNWPLDPIIMDFIPSAAALDESCMALHEMLGRWWYKIRY